jgi:S-(hydroxymethyl)glutathione dehydrogenase/alcohol dehydrogenase
MTSSVDSLAAIADGAGQFVINTVQVQPPQAGEVRVRLQTAGICHTDHASLTWPGPLVMGHEGAALVEAVGDGVTALSVGDRVLMNWAIPCGQCPQCLRGRGNICERSMGVDPSLGTSRAAPGHTLWKGQSIDRSFNLGTFSQYSVVRAEALTIIPASIPLKSACILGCGVMTGVGSAINIANVQPGDTVAVVGCGGVGLSTIQGARIAGASQIIAIDRREAGLERARTAGATHTVLVAHDDHNNDRMVEDVKRLTMGRMADHAFEATSVHALAFLPLRLARQGGNAVQLSGAHGPVTVEMPSFWWDKKYITPLYGGCLPSRDFPRLFNWVDEGKLDIDGMVTRTYLLHELGTALDDMLTGRTAKGVILLD